MKTARDHAPYHDIPMFGGDEIGVAGILRVQHGAAVARQQSLDRQLPIEHGHHHIAVLGLQRTVHDQPIAVENAGPLHGVAGDGGDECVFRVLDHYYT